MFIYSNNDNKNCYAKKLTHLRPEKGKQILIFYK